jgi:intein-encoded DNA endonuclease-like protein
MLSSIGLYYGNVKVSLHKKINFTFILKIYILGGFHFSSSYYFMRQIFNMNLEFFKKTTAQTRMNGDTTLNS